MNMLATAAVLSDNDLLAHVCSLAQRERESSVELVAHLVARLAPRPDAPAYVRKLPAPAATAARQPRFATTVPASAAGPEVEAGPTVEAPPLRRPVIAPTAPERYRVQFTIGQEAHDMLREVQRLLRREIPDGDPGAIFERALPLLRKKVAGKKLGETSKPRRAPAGSGTSWDVLTTTVHGRYIPVEVRCFVWRRDGGRCAFVSSDGRRCCAREYLEWHHVDPYGKGGPPTVENISLRCRGHNVYESELIFGPYRSGPAAGAERGSGAERGVQGHRLQPAIADGP